MGLHGGSNPTDLQASMAFRLRVHDSLLMNIHADHGDMYIGLSGTTGTFLGITHLNNESDVLPDEL